MRRARRDLDKKIHLNLNQNLDFKVYLDQRDSREEASNKGLKLAKKASVSFLHRDHRDASSYNDHDAGPSYHRHQLQTWIKIHSFYAAITNCERKEVELLSLFW